MVQKRGVTLGERFGTRVVVEEEPAVNYRTRVRVRCDCGDESVVYLTDIANGHGRSCRSCATTKHGWSKGKRTSEYNIWCGIVQRCCNSNNRAYRHYGGRGITVCERWLGVGGFERFLQDMGARPSQRHTVERIDNNGGYSPANCVWATMAEQAKNKRDTRLVEAHGEALTIAEWSRRTGIERSTIGARLARGWAPEKALIPGRASVL